MAPDFLHITSSWNLIGSDQNPASIVAQQTTQTCSLEMTWSMLPRKLGRSKGLGMCGELWILNSKVLALFILAFLTTLSFKCEREQNIECWILSDRFHHCTTFSMNFFFFFFRIYNITKEFPSKEKGKEKVKAVEG